MKRLDAGMLALCTRISHRLQRVAGLTNFFIAKCFGVLVAGLAVVELMVDYHVSPSSPNVSVSRLLNDGMGLLWAGYTFLIRPEQEERDFFVYAGAQWRRPVSPREPVVWRPVWLVVSVILPCALLAVGRPLGLVVRSTQMVWAMLSLYFLAVVPLPPGQETVRESDWHPFASSPAPID